MGECAEPGCNAGVSGLKKAVSQVCLGCQQRFCGDHTFEVGDLAHLTRAGSPQPLAAAVVAHGELCWSCIREMDGFDDSWRGCIVDRECSHTNCDRALWRGQRACGFCGQLFCKKHSNKRTAVELDWWNRTVPHPEADGVCFDCQSDRRKALPWSAESQLGQLWDPGDRRAAESALVWMRAMLPLEGGAGRWTLVAEAAPLILDSLIHAMDEPRIGFDDKIRVARAISYMVSPLDLMPLEVFGPRALVGDTAIGVDALLVLREAYDADLVRDLWQGEGDATDTLRRLQQDAKLELPVRLWRRGVELLAQDGWEFPASDLPLLEHDASDREREDAIERKARYSLGFLEQHRAPVAPSSRRLVFVPGFLTEDGRMKEWKIALEALALPPDVGIYIYHWPSKQGLHMLDVFRALGIDGALAAAPYIANAAAKQFLKKAIGGAVAGPIGVALGFLGLGSDLNNIRRAWIDARDAVDFNAIVLAGLCLSDGFRGNTTLIGHSLGGRMVLMAAELTAELADAAGERPVAPLRSVVSLAPAVGPKQVELARAASGVSGPCRVYFSEKDWVLQVAYWAAEGFANAIGSHPPNEHPTGMTFHDANAVRKGGVGHTNYASILPDLLDARRRWW